MLPFLSNIDDPSTEKLCKILLTFDFTALVSMQPVIAVTLHAAKYHFRYIAFMTNGLTAGILAVAILSLLFRFLRDAERHGLEMEMKNLESVGGPNWLEEWDKLLHMIWPCEWRVVLNQATGIALSFFGLSMFLLFNLHSIGALLKARR